MRLASYTFPPFSRTRDVAGHPLFRGILSRIVWRFFTERISPAGHGLVWATLLVTHFTICSLDIQAYVLFSYLVGVWGVAQAASWTFRPRVRLETRHGGRVGADEVLPVDVEVRQLWGESLPDLRVLAHRLPLGVEAVEDGGVAVPRLRRGEAARVRLGLRCPRRGVYRLRGYRTETSFPFGLLMASRFHPDPSTLLVYPRFQPLSRLEIERGRRFHAGGVALTTSVGDATEYLGNREYRSGDSVRDIDWRATARLSRPIVREYREEYYLRVAVVLDTYVPRLPEGEPDPDLERAVSLCAAVSDFMARQEYLVDLFAAGPDLYHLTAGRGLAYLDQILDILACVTPSPDRSFERLEPEIAENLAQITTVVCIFLDWDEPRREFVRHLRDHGTGVKTLIVREGRCTVDPAGDAGLIGPAPVIDRERFVSGLGEL